MARLLTKLRNRKRPQEDPTPYQLFIVAITILSLVNIVLLLVIKDPVLLITIQTMDLLLSLLFFIDFLRLFYKAENKVHYFFKDYGWADLLASFPFPQLKLLRIFRLVKAYGIIKRAGFEGVKRGFNKNRASAAVLLVFFIILLLLEFGSVGILALENNSPDANIKTASDAMWWVYVTITTVGYGDRYPVTNGGRLFATFIMLVGVGLFGVITGFLANKFLPSSSANPETDSVALNKDAAIAHMREEIKEIHVLLAAKEGKSKKKDGSS